MVVAGALGPFQSARLVWPLTSVPAVVRSSRQATLMVSAPLTFTLSTRAQWPAAGLSAAAGEAVARASPRARSVVAVAARSRWDDRGWRMDPFSRVLAGEVVCAAHRVWGMPWCHVAVGGGT